MGTFNYKFSYFFGWGRLDLLFKKGTLYFGLKELKVSTVDNNKYFLNLRLLHKLNCQKTEWDLARFYSLV